MELHHWATDVKRLSYFVTDPKNSVVVEFDPSIPKSYRKIITATLAEVLKFFPGLDVPEKVTFHKRGDGLREGGAAGIMVDEIDLTSSAFLLTKKSFRVLLAHEVTHLVVARALRQGLSGYTVLQALLAAKDDPMEQTMINQNHLPYAELLCDVAAVLVTDNLQALPDLLHELQVLGEKNPALAAAVTRALKDQPAALSRRDFSISAEDPAWKSYEPSDGYYNRFNQIRAYLGTRILGLASNQRRLFIPALLNAVDPIFSGGGLDKVMIMNGIPASNAAFIQYLESQLEL